MTTEEKKEHKELQQAYEDAMFIESAFDLLLARIAGEPDPDIEDLLISLSDEEDWKAIYLKVLGIRNRCIIERQHGMGIFEIEGKIVDYE